MATLTGAHLALRCLKLEGIQKIFTLVGDTILPICDATIDEGIDLIDTRNEAAAMHMADGWARITGQPAVAMFTGGAGYANAVSALPNIYTNESPVIFIAGSGALPELERSFHEIDQVGMAAPAVKGSWLVRDRRRIPDTVATAFRTALAGRPGPVHITIPVDIQNEKLSEQELPQFMPEEYRHMGRTLGDPNLIQQAMGLLRKAVRPVVIAGNPARYSVASESLQQFIETTGLPLFTVEQARGLVSDDHPLCFGYADAALNDAAKSFREADVVLLLGKRFDRRNRYGRPPFFSPTAAFIQVDPSPAEIGRNHGVALGIVGNLGAVVRQLTEEARRHNWKELSDWTRQLREAHNAQREWLEAEASDDLPLHPMRVVKEVDQFIDENTVIVIDGGDFVQWPRTYLKARKPGYWMRLGPLAQLGCGLPYALAAKLARPEARVLLFIGDGSFGFYGIEYDTAIRHNLPIIAILGNDSAWGIDKTYQLAYFGRAIGTDLRLVRYDQMVAALGGHGEYVEQPQEIAPALQRALASGKPSLLNIIIRSVPSPLSQAMIASRRENH